MCVYNMCRGVVTVFPNKVYFHDGIAFLEYGEFDLMVYPIYAIISSGLCVHLELGMSWGLIHSLCFNKIPHCTT